MRIGGSCCHDANGGQMTGSVRQYFPARASAIATSLRGVVVPFLGIAARSLGIAVRSEGTAVVSVSIAVLSLDTALRFWAAMVGSDERIVPSDAPAVTIQDTAIPF